MQSYSIIMITATHTWTANVPIPPEPPSTSALHLTTTHGILC